MSTFLLLRRTRLRHKRQHFLSLVPLHCDVKKRCYRKLREAPHRGHFSLGVYSTKERAVTRKDRLGRLGIDTQLVPRERKRSQWWIDIVVVADEQEYRLDQLKQAGYPIEVASDTAGS